MKNFLHILQVIDACKLTVDADGLFWSRLILFACWIKGQACALEGCPMVVGFERASD